MLPAPRRKLRTLALLLLAGFVLQCLVTALLVWLPLFGSGTARISQSAWHATLLDPSVPEDYTKIGIESFLGWTHVSAIYALDALPPEKPSNIIVFRMGFPFRSLTGREEINSHSTAGGVTQINRFFLPRTGPFHTSRVWLGRHLSATSYASAVPTKPLPLGIVANTLFFSALIALARGLVLRFRRSRAVAQGACRACGYAMHALPRCPECGSAPECLAPSSRTSHSPTSPHASRPLAFPPKGTRMAPPSTHAQSHAQPHAQSHARCTCPRCGYDVQGDADRWNRAPTDALASEVGAACPLRGTCPECGVRFSWAALMRPGLVSPTWFVETAQAFGRANRSGVRTTLRALTPWRFWREISLETPSDLRRRLWWFLGACVASTLVVALAALLFSLLYFVTISQWQFQGTRAITLTELSRVASFITSSLTKGLLSPLSGSTWYRCFLVGAVGYPLMVMLLSQSRKLAKVRGMHVLRASVYACALWPAMLVVGFVLSVLAALGAPFNSVFRLLASLTPLADLARPNINNHLIYPIVMLWFPLWWAFAIRSWRMQQAWMVWLAVTLTSLLIQAFALLASANFRFPGPLGDAIKRWFLL
jgi:hypothetical protein